MVYRALRGFMKPDLFPGEKKIGYKGGYVTCGHKQKLEMSNLRSERKNIMICSQKGPKTSHL